MRQSMPNGSATSAANARSNASASRSSPSSRNSVRMKKAPPAGSVVCWSDCTMFAPRSRRKLDSAATIPGWSVQDTSSRPTPSREAGPDAIELIYQIDHDRAGARITGPRGAEPAGARPACRRWRGGGARGDRRRGAADTGAQLAQPQRGVRRPPAAEGGEPAADRLVQAARRAAQDRPARRRRAPGRGGGQRRATTPSRWPTRPAHAGCRARSTCPRRRRWPRSRRSRASAGS